MANRFVECDLTNDGRGRWMDDRQLVCGLDRDDYTMRGRVVLRVSCLTAELDLRGDSVGRRIDYKVAPSRFVRDEDTPLHGRIRDPVREPRPGDARHDLKGGIVDDHNRLVAGRLGIPPMPGRPAEGTGRRRCLAGRDEGKRCKQEGQGHGASAVAVRSSNRVCESALVHTPTSPGAVNRVSWTSISFLPLK